VGRQQGRRQPRLAAANGCLGTRSVPEDRQCAHQLDPYSAHPSSVSAVWCSESSISPTGQHCVELGEFDRNSSITKAVSRSRHPRRQLAPPRRVAPGRRGRRGFFATRPARRSILNAIVDRLDYLRDFGFNAILFMRWTAWSGDHPDYAPFQYFSVEARYAHDLLAPTEKLSWLKRLLNEYEVEA
jgi:hypothetical protein